MEAMTEENKIVQLAYCSTSNRMLTTQELDGLLSVAVSNNEKAQITGMLIYSGGSFFQWLEGPAETVDNLFKKIVLDERHRNCTVILREGATERSFSRWAMAYASSSDLDEKGQEAFVTLREIQDGRTSIAHSETVAHAIIQSFIRNNP